MKRAWYGLVMALGLSACGGGYQGGIHGKLSFHDDTDTAQTFKGIRPVAAGATLHLGMFGSDSPVTLTSSKAAVLSVIDTDSPYYSGFTLHAGKPGTSRITAESWSARDSIDLRVEAIKSSQVLFAWKAGWEAPDILNDVFLSDALPASLPDIAMGPDAQASFVLWNQDNSGESLTGFGAEPIAATPASAVVRKEDSDFFTLVAPHDAGTTIALDAGTLHYDIDVVDPTTVATQELRVYGPHTADPSGDPVGAALTIPVGKWSFRLDAWLADGRYLIADCPDFAVTSSVPGRVVRAWGRLPSGSQAARQVWFVLDFRSEGTTTLGLTCLGRTLSYDVTVQPASG